MLQSKSFFANVLALSLLFNKAQGHLLTNKLVGYARVSPEMAARINADNKLHMGDPSSADNLGPGFYLGQVPSFNHYSEEEGEWSWYCAVLGSDWKMARAKIVYLPANYHIGGSIGEDEMDTFTHWLTSQTSDKQLRLALVKNAQPRQMKMRISPSSIENNYLNLEAHCYESETKMRDSLEQFQDFIEWNWKLWKWPGRNSRLWKWPGRN